MKLAGIRWCLFALLALAAGGALAGDEEPPGSWLGIRLGGPAAADGGVEISRIFVDSPADRAGLRARDVIVSFGGRPLTGFRELVERIRSHEPGSWVPLTVRRQGDPFELEVRLGERPAAIGKGKTRRGWIGVGAIDLPPSLREHFGAPAESGVMIAEVVEASPAEAAGFRLGDVVYEVGGRPVGSVGALRELVAGAGVDNEWEFAVARDGALLVLEARVQAAPAPAR